MAAYIDSEGDALWNNTVKLSTHYTTYWMICRYEANRNHRSFTSCCVYALYARSHGRERRRSVGRTCSSLAVLHQYIVPDRWYTILDIASSSHFPVCTQL